MSPKLRLEQALLTRILIATSSQVRKRGEPFIPASLIVCVATAIYFHLEHGQTTTAMLHSFMILSAIFIASLIAAIAGFAFSAVAAALLVHIYHEPAEMVRTLLVCSIAVQIYCTAMILGKVQWRELAPYLIGGLITAPIGIVILKHVSPNTYALLLGLLLVSYSLYALTNPLRVAASKNAGMDAAVGALGGITGGVAAFPGAFPVIWCSARGLSKEHQRAICQPYILIMQVSSLGWFEHAHSGQTRSLVELWTFIPVALVGAWLGFEVFRRISPRQFNIVVLAVLGVSGALLLARGW